MYSTKQQQHFINIDTSNRSEHHRANSSGFQQQSPLSTSPYHTTTTFGPMAIHPSSTFGTTTATTTDVANWFSTSIESTTSSFGQSSVFGANPTPTPTSNTTPTTTTNNNKNTQDLIMTPSNSTGHLIEGFPNNELNNDINNQKNHQEMFEKRRRRRESHNAVERRRRDNINERIYELSTLLPDHLIDSVPASSNVMSIAPGQSGTNAKPINKGTILKLSVDHIKELREEISGYKNRILELESLIDMAKKDHHPLTSTKIKHERIGSIQFQQQFGKLHITGSEK
ncbi:helix-loop-helix DNA-binding domain-containing protein [Cokeromyces recurvatus]|uniref:helix-loop-helix DNA-binding domain-containing protein n=1 Tax=Cokeromyces recurvatus TaxID=90255 RepID=UPI0022207C73|nr:helix-loop-helix DNA-binding domain-containing protein [Cokeromyces recurvatus]KAI7905384.1 helix-loop-helix DNA-binding domain-containing protein [Cokeromyces recurvatus]